MDFDQCKDQYRQQVRESLVVPKTDSDFILEFKADRMKDFLSRRGATLGSLQVLDVGCGIGLMDRYFSGCFGGLHGVDVAAETLKMATANNPSVKYDHYDGKTLPYPDASFDVTFAICVIHHVAPEQWPGFLSEMKRVTRVGGYVVIFEHNPWNPLTRAVVNRCEFDKDAVLISSPKLVRIAREAGLQVEEKSTILYFPWRGKVFRFLERWLEWFPFGAQYYTAFVKPGIQLEIKKPLQ